MKFDWPRFPSDNLHHHSHLGHDLMELVQGPHQHLRIQKSSCEIKFPLGLNCLDWRQAITEQAHLNSCDSPKKKKKKTINPLFNLWINPMNPGSNAGACWGK